MNTIVPPQLGQTAGSFAITSLEELQQTSFAMAEQARRSLEILTRDLELRVYGAEPFLIAVRKLATTSRVARVRILVREIDGAIRDDHRLIELARRLSSFIEIRCLSEAHRTLNEAMLIADQQGYIHRLAGDLPAGSADFRNPLQARELLRVFDDAWAHGERDPNLRRLHI